jgi:KaiC/GvpD/RAD55 family RecA-like ATPase
MVEESSVVRPGEPRVSTGNPSLDAMLEGGLVARRPYLVVGPSGTGKTTLSIQFLCEGVRRHERVLLVTLEEPPNEARVNHRGLEPDLSRVEVFDAIPDIMRYERTPFKDIASVRYAVPFSQVPFRIRQSPELASVEVTITALEQMLRTEVIRKGYTRLVIDSLTALQYFCMKGFDPVAGAQSFLRFLSDLRVTTILTVEAPLEDVESAERSLARGEIRLFRWELDGQTVRAVGVEKFRGSSHDVRLHPYRIGPQGLDINLEVTVSRDTRQIIEPIVRRPSAPEAAASTAPFVSAVTPLIDELRDLVLLGADVAPARSEIEAALAATNEGQLDQARAHLSRVSSLVMVLVDRLKGPRPVATEDPGAASALQRVLARADSVRTGVPPTSLPPASVLQVQLGALLSLLPTPSPAPTPEGVMPPERGPAPTAAPAPVSAPVPAPAPVSKPVPTAIVSEIAPPKVAPPPAVAEAPRPSPAVSVPRPSPPEVAPTPTPKAEPSHAPKVVERPARAEKAVEAPRPAAARPLPPPPKPRATVAAPRIPKAAPAPPPQPGLKKGEPPPLPSAPAPEWRSPPAAPPTVPKSPAPVGHPTPSVPSSIPPPTPAPKATLVPAKKRRKPAAPSKKAPVPARAPVSHEPPITAAPHPADVESAPTEPSPTASPPAHVEAPVPPKPRRRTSRKRKAPPVVSAEVEPIPPGVFGTPDENSASRDDPDPTVPPEG